MSLDSNNTLLNTNNEIIERIKTKASKVGNNSIRICYGDEDIPSANDLSPEDRVFVIERKKNRWHPSTANNNVVYPFSSFRAYNIFDCSYSNSVTTTGLFGSTITVDINVSDSEIIFHYKSTGIGAKDYTYAWDSTDGVVYTYRGVIIGTNAISSELASLSMASNIIDLLVSDWDEGAFIMSYCFSTEEQEYITKAYRCIVSSGGSGSASNWASYTFDLNKTTVNQETYDPYVAYNRDMLYWDDHLDLVQPYINDTAIMLIEDGDVSYAVPYRAELVYDMSTDTWYAGTVKTGLTYSKKENGIITTATGGTEMIVPQAQSWTNGTKVYKYVQLSKNARVAEFYKSDANRSIYAPTIHFVKTLGTEYVAYHNQDYMIHKELKNVEIDETLWGMDATATSKDVIEGKQTFFKGLMIGGTAKIEEPKVKLFSSIDELNNSENNKEGNLAIVYRNETMNATVDSTFSSAKFPTTVTLPTAITDYVEVRYEAVGGSMFDCWGDLSADYFSMNCYTESDEIRIEYESSDGVTYTRIDGGEETIDFGTEIFYAYPEMWNDAIGYFIQVGGSYFDGLFKYTKYTDENEVRLLKTESISGSGSSITNANIIEENSINIQDVNDIISNIMEETGDTDASHYWLSKINDKYVILFAKSIYGLMTNTTNDAFIGFIAQHIYSYSTDLNIYDIDLVNKTYTFNCTVVKSELTEGKSSTDPQTCYYVDNIQVVPLSCYNMQYSNHISTFLDNNSYYYFRTNYNISVVYIDILEYKYAPTQFNATAEDVYNKTFYGKNGTEIGVLQNNTINDNKAALLNKCNLWNDLSEIHITGNIRNAFNGYEGEYLPKIYATNNDDIAYLFYNCPNLKEVDVSHIEMVDTAEYILAKCPSLENIIGLDNWDVSQLTSLYGFFNGDTSLTRLDLSSWDTSNVNCFGSIFANCTSLNYIDISSWIFTNYDTSKTQTDTFSGVPTSCTILVKDQAAIDFLSQYDSTHTYTIKTES